mgnify:CR=1 FL=1
MKKLSIFVGMIILTTLLFVLFNKLSSEEAATDHKDRISGPFATPQDVTKACLECHQDEADNFMKTRHWNWLGEEIDVPGRGKMKFGKRVSINNFCIAIPSNEPRCTSCHPGYGWRDSTFDFTNADNIDCLICHDNSGKYKKVPTEAGMPDPTVDLLLAAQSVGKPKKQNCGNCHFEGGGGTAVKHGDLDPSVLTANKELDVHMGGMKFECIDCHKSEKHQIKGASHGSMISNSNHIACTNCHSGGKLHKNQILNKHTASIACETCHIPEFARGMATKTYWDCSTAGQREDETGADGLEKYIKMNGDCIWEKDVIPTYSWYNGGADYYLPGDKIEPAKTVKLNSLRGDITDRNAKISPFKVMRGKQIYDTKFSYLIIPKLFGEGGYWKTYDWNNASKLGMEAAKLPYSGEYGFIETEMYWPINHTVAEKSKAVKCNECHNAGKRMDWKALGYENDPMKKGGREKNGLIKN